VVQARELDNRVVLAYVGATLNAPTGPLAGETKALASVVLVGAGDEHRIAAFHNTVVASGIVGGRAGRMPPTAEA
jgi:hypothetical protein